VIELSETYYEKNKEKLIEQGRKYYAENREEILERRRQQRKTHPVDKEANKIYKKAYYEKNKEKVIKQCQEYYAENREKILSQQKQHLKEHPRERIVDKEGSKRYYENNRQEAIDKAKQSYYNKSDQRKINKIEAFSIVSKTGVVECEVCHIAEVPYLTIDHIEEGRSDKRKYGGGYVLYAAIASGKVPNEYLSGLRVLCFNHNCSRSQKCSPQTESLKITAYKIISDKIECAKCGDTELTHLTIDHIDRGGSIQRKRFSTGRDFYRAIIKGKLSDEELKNLRILCWNHNCGWRD
jgi:hypothetical protein